MLAARRTQIVFWIVGLALLWLALSACQPKYNLYPGSGYAEESGTGNILNLPLAPGSGSKEFRSVWSTLGLPAIHGFEPDLILVSAGFDAHRRDPLAHLEVEDDDFRWITEQVRGLAEDSAGGKLVSILEGGYDLKSLATASRAHVEALMV